MLGWSHHDSHHPATFHVMSGRWAASTPTSGCSCSRRKLAGLQQPVQRQWSTYLVHVKCSTVRECSVCCVQRAGSLAAQLLANLQKATDIDFIYHRKEVSISYTCSTRRPQVTCMLLVGAHTNNPIMFCTASSNSSCDWVGCPNNWSRDPFRYRNHTMYFVKIIRSIAQL
jgi:hypothetical protein